MHPDIHDTGVVLGLTHRIGNATATLGMINPEVANTFIWIRQREFATLRMGERRRVEVKFHIVLLGPVYPALEMLHLHFITIDELSTEITIDLMEVQTVVARNKGLDELDVLTYLVDITGTSRIVSCGLNAAREGVVTLETHHIIRLPAVQ